MHSGSVLLLQLAGAVALLLWGLSMLSAAVGKTFGWRLKRLAAMSGERRLGVFGAGVVMGGSFQSSTAAILLGGQMAAQGALSTVQGLALALGADVGATFAAQLFSRDLTALAPPMLLAAYLTNRIGKGDIARQSAHIVFGVALVIVALQMIFSATEPLRESKTIHLLMMMISDEPLLLIVLATMLTFICHSALAVVLIVAALAAGDVLGPTSALWMVLGANLGAGLPPLLASWGEAVELRRITAGNALFRLLGVLALVPFVGLWATTTMEWFLPQHAVVHFHTFVNLAMSIPLLFFTPAVGSWMERAFKTLDSKNEWRRLRYLDASGTRAPAPALTQAIRETLNMGDLVARMLEKSARLVKSDDPQARAEIGELDDAVDFLNREIKLFTADLETGGMSGEDKRRANLVLSTITHLEHIGDIIDNGIRAVVRRMRARRVRFSSDGIDEIRDIHNLVRRDLGDTLGLLVSPDVVIARDLHERRLELNRRCGQTFQNHLTRLRCGRAESIETSSMHLDLVRDLKRISDHIAEIADSILSVSPQSAAKNNATQKPTEQPRASVADEN